MIMGQGNFGAAKSLVGRQSVVVELGILHNSASNTDMRRVF